MPISTLTFFPHFEYEEWNGTLKVIPSHSGYLLGTNQPLDVEFLQWLLPYLIHLDSFHSFYWGKKNSARDGTKRAITGMNWSQGGRVG